MRSHMKSVDTNSAWQIKLLYDGECPLCVKEVNFLKQKDRGRGLVLFVDVADLNYEPQQHGGIDFATAMGRIHAILPNGEIIKNIEVFRRIYEILGMGWVYRFTKIPMMETCVNFIYGIWADLRLKLTGRPDLATLVKLRQDCTQKERCRL
jgi:predicted DCC family thiol-disulfide oxidoreductase YuxK